MSATAPARRLAATAACAPGEPDRRLICIKQNAIPQATDSRDLWPFCFGRELSRGCFMSVPAAFLGVILIWSTTPLAIKWSAEGGGFLFGVSARMLLGA